MRHLFVLMRPFTAAALLLAAHAAAGTAELPTVERWGSLAPAREVVPVGPELCLLPSDPPEYYAIELVPTRQVTGTGRASGTAHTSFAHTPFGVSTASNGSYRLTLHIEVRNLPELDEDEFVAWATTPSLDQVVRIGDLDAEGRAEGPVTWNKFLVVVTLEPEGAGEVADADAWTGPIVLRGMSRSGRMHTMAGHGPFEQQECAAFGY